MLSIRIALLLAFALISSLAIATETGYRQEKATGRSAPNGFSHSDFISHRLLNDASSLVYDTPKQASRESSASVDGMDDAGFGTSLGLYVVSFLLPIYLDVIH